MVNGPVKKLFESSLYVQPLSQALGKKTKKKGQRKWNHELLEEISRIREIDREGQRWSEKNYWGGYTSYSSTSQSFDKLYRFSSTFEALEKKIRPQVLKFAQSLFWDFEPLDLKISTMWVNVMPQGTSHSFHHHPLSVISGTFYVKVPKGSSGIQFEDPRLSLMMATPPRNSKTPPSQLPHFSLNPQEGDLVLFESWMKHQVPPQPVKSERVSVSFNYDWIRS